MDTTMAKNPTTVETPRTCTNINPETSRVCTKRAPCPTCWDVVVEAMEREKMRYDMHDVWGDWLPEVL
jgi:hypothetical protein